MKNKSADVTAANKKRVAHEGALSERPLHMRKPSQRTPAQVMADRYKKLQMMRQQQLIENKLTDDPGRAE